MGSFNFRKGSSSNKVTNDTLTTNDTVEVLLGISEGPIQGPADGPKSFYADDTALVDANGSPNLSNFSLDFWPGDETGHDVAMTLGGFGSPINIGQHLLQNQAIVRAGTQTQITAVDFRILISSLQGQDSKGNTFTEKLQLKLEYKKLSDADWQPCFTTPQYNSNGSLSGSSPVGSPSGSPAGWAYSGADRITAALFPDRAVSATSGAPTSAPSDPTQSALAIDSTTTTGSDVATYHWDTGSQTWVYALSASSGAYATWNDNGTTRRIYRPASTAPSGARPGDVWERGVGDYLVWNGSAWVIPEKYGSYAPTTQYLSNGVWTTTQKISSTTAITIRVIVPSVDEPYEYRLTKLTQDSDAGHTQEVSWDGVYEVKQTAWHFDALALVKILGKASEQFSSLPNWSGIYDGRIVKVPTNYDPVARTYDGVWDGSYKLAYTNNTAWVFLDFIENDRYGLSAIYPHTADKWAIYQWAQNCDTMVPKADGTMQPRWTFNYYFQQPTDAQEMARYIAASGGAVYVDDGNGFVTVLIDQDDPATALFTPENVTPDGFSYAYTERLGRANYLTVAFINPDMNWQQDHRVVKDDTDIAQYGTISDNFIATGCTDPDEAVRRGRRKMISDLTEYETVTFSTNRKGRYLSEWSIILIADPSLGRGLSGRIEAVTGSRTVTLRDPISLEAGFTYIATFDYATANGFETKSLNVTTAAGSTTTLSFDADLPDLAEFAAFTLEAEGIIGAPVPYRILDLNDENGQGEYIRVTAVKLNRNKYSYIDQAQDLGTISYSSFSNTSVLPATSPKVVVNTRPVGAVTARVLEVSWEPSDTAFVRRYKVYHSINGSTATMTETSDTTIEFDGAASGDHTFSVVAVNLTGYESKPLSFTYTLAGEVAPVPSPTNLRLVGGVSANAFDTLDATFAFDAVQWASLAAYEISISDIDSTVIRLENVGLKTTYTYDFGTNKSDGLRRTFIVGVRAVDQDGNKSSLVTLQVSNPAPAAPNITVEPTVKGFNISLSPSSDRDVAGALVWVSETDGFDPSQVTAAADGKQSSFSITNSSANTQYIRAAYYDSFDKTPAKLNVSPQVGENVTLLGALADLNSLGYGSPYLTGFGSLAGLGNLFFGSPYLLEAEAGAIASLANFKTAIGVAAGFYGQGSLATLSNIGWGSGLLTGVPSALGLDAYNRLYAWNISYNDGNGNIIDVNSLRPGEGGANITENRIAAAFYGQGALASLSNISYGSQYLSGFGGLAGYNFVRTNLTGGSGDSIGLYSDNYGWLTDNALYTSIGTAAAFSGQSAWATYNGLNPNNIAGQVQRLGTDGNIESSAIYKSNVGWLNQTWPQEAGANITENRTAAAFNGQSAWATYGGLNPNNVAGQVQNLYTNGYMEANYVMRSGVAYLSQVWPAEYGANVTESRTAAAINGQGWGATASQSQVDNAQVPTGANAVTNSEMSVMNGTFPLGLTGAWPGNFDNYSALTITDSTVILPGGTVKAIKRAITGTPTPSTGVFDNLNMDPALVYLLPVAPGDWVAASVRVAHQNCASVNIGVSLMGANGGYVSERHGDSIAANINGDTTDIASWGLATVIFQVPADGVESQPIRFVRIQGARFLPNGATNPVGWASQPFLAKVASGQTVVPAYSPGPTSRLADQTSLNTAAALSGQSAWATYNGLNPNNVAGQVQRLGTDGNIESSAIYKSNVGWLNQTWPQEANANVTENRTAAAFSGQSAWATYNGLNPNNVAGQVSKLQTDGNIESSIIYKANTGWLNQTWPQEANANVTENRTAAAINGQGDLATKNQSSLPFGSNRVVDSDFTRWSYGWGGCTTSAWTSDGAFPVGDWGINMPSWSGMRNVLYCHVATGGAAWNDTGDSHIDAFWSRGAWGGSASDLKAFGMPVKKGDNVFARILAAHHRCNARLYLLIYDQNGTLIDTPAWDGGREGGGANGDPANFDVVGGCYTLQNPASAYAQIMIRMYANGGSDPYIFLTEPMMGVLPAGQTVLPPYQSGPTDPYGDQTGSNTAAALSGQSAWATYSGLNPNNVAGQVSKLQTDGNIESSTIYKANTGWLNQTWPQEGGANVTENRTAAAFNGQGWFATQSYVSLASANITDRKITYLTRADGSTQITDETVVTSIGVAAAFAGQGALATKNTADTSDVAANAITNTQFNQVTNFSASVTSSGDTTIINKVITTHGGYVELMATLWISGGNSGVYKVHITRYNASQGFVQLAEIGFIQDTGARSAWPVHFIDSPIATDNTYIVAVRLQSGGGNITVPYASLKLTEFKR